MSQYISIHELILAIVMVLIVVLVLIISVLIFSFYKYRSLQHRNTWAAIIQRKITEAIVDGADQLPEDHSFALHLREPSFRHYFLAALVSSGRKFTGKAKVEVNNLFNVFSLEDDALAKIRSKKNYLIAGGIQELTAMKVQHALPQIVSFLNHPDRQVYQEAQYAIVSFKGFEGLFFLDELVYPLSDWQQLRLLRSIEEVPEMHVGKIVDWLNSTNESVIVFVLRLIGQFRLLSYYPHVLLLLEHDSIYVRRHAVRTLQGLENQQTAIQLMTTFVDQPYDVQLEILKALKIAKNRQTDLFLKKQLWQHIDSGVKVLAAEILMSLGEQSYLYEIAFHSETPEEISNIAKHALQQQLC